ncbi:MAG: tRNA epoxyqueuosine(34) reductase QueG [Bacteroidales bacterium]|nr:tRNA epoxyqueuosine(34) reductase QueG [Bacteroidales bacterium]
MNKTRLSILIKEKALSLGFSDCGIAKAQDLPLNAAWLKDWLSKDMHGQMHYMANHFDKRVDPTKLVEGARSVISVVINYYPVEKQYDTTAPTISKYAYGKDYHLVLKGKLKNLLTWVQELNPEVEGRFFVDSAPVLDRAWAQRAGLGWIGKNSNLISPKHGSFVFIGSLIVNIELDYNQSFIKDYCGGCNKCMQACPTQAIVAPRVVDGSKCISYFTIELKEESLPEEYRGKFLNRIFGCDICQDVCPWNRNVKPTHEEQFTPHPRLISMLKAEWQQLSEEEFDQMFKDSAVKRAKYSGLKRNIGFVE